MAATNKDPRKWDDVRVDRANITGTDEMIGAKLTDVFNIIDGSESQIILTFDNDLAVIIYPTLEYHDHEDFTVITHVEGGRKF